MNDLPKASLLRLKREFDQVYRSGKRIHGEGFSLIYTANNQQQSRLGISVPKKVGNAVLRNRIKRIIREIFRTHRQQFPAGADIVVTVRPGFPARKATDFHEQVTALLRGQAHGSLALAS